MASLLDLFVKITADPSEYKKALKESQQLTNEFANLAEAAGVRIATSLSMGGVMAGAVSAAEKFEQAGFQIQRSTGATGEKLAGLKTAMEDLYAGSARSADEIAGALSQIAIRTGLQGSALESLTRHTMDFAKVTGSDLQESVKTNEKLFQQWGLTTDEQAKAMDQLYVASTKTGQSTQYFSESLLSMGPTLRAFGYLFPDAVALVGTFARAGLNATEATRGLNTMFAKMVAAGKDPRAELQKLIEKLGDTATATQAAAILIEDGFSKRAVLQMADALSRGVFSIGEFRKALEGASGAARKTAEQTETVEEKFFKLLHELNVNAAPAGGVVLDVLAQLIEGAAKTAEAFARMGKAIFNGTRGKTEEYGTLEEFDAGMARTYGTNPTGQQAQIVAAMRAAFVKAHPSKPSALDTSSIGGSGGSGLNDKSVKSDFSALHIQDLAGELAAATKAYSELTAAGKLNDGQIKEATEYIDGLRAKLSMLHQGITGDGTDSAALLKTLGLPAPADIEPIKNAFGELVTRFGSFVGPKSKQQLDTMSAAWIAYGKALHDNELAQRANEVPLYDAIAAQNKENAELQQTLDLLAQMPARQNAVALPLAEAQGALDGITKAFEYFGEKTPWELAETARAAQKNFEIIASSGTASADAVQGAWRQSIQAQIDAQLAAGKITKQEYDDAEKRLKEDSRDGYAAAQKSADQYAKRTADGLAHSLAADIVQWKGFATTLKDLFTHMAEDLLGIMLQKLLEPLMASFATTLLGLFGGFGGGIGGLFAGSTGAGASLPGFGSFVGGIGDGIVSAGKIVTTSPSDYIMAAKDPAKLMSGGSGAGGAMAVHFNGPVTFGAGTSQSQVTSMMNTAVRQLRMAGARI